MRKIIPSVIVPLSRDLARVFADMERAPMERPFSQRHIERLVHSMSITPIVMLTWSLALRQAIDLAGTTPKQVLDGLRACNRELLRRLNGQHTSYLFAEGLVAIPSGAEVTIERWVCESPEEEVKVWSAYDIQVSIRTHREMVAAVASSIKPLAGVSPAIISSAAAGALFSERGGAIPHSVPAVTTHEVVKDNVDFILFVNSVFASVPDRAARSGDMVRRLCRESVQAAMHRTWKLDPTAAFTFWHQVLSGEGGSARHPARAVREYLLTTSASAGALHKQGLIEPKQAALAKCIYAWNKWRKHRQVASLRASSVVNARGRTVVVVPEAV